MQYILKAAGLTPWTRQNQLATSSKKSKNSAPKNISDAELLQTRIIETGIDSLELMELIMEIEGEYNIEIADSQLSDDLTVSRFCDLVTTLCGL